MDQNSNTGFSLPAFFRANTLVVVVVALILVGVIVLGVLYFTRSGSNTPITSEQALPEEVVVQLTEDGFSPDEVTIAPGTAVRWVNSTSEDGTVNSDDYPDNQKYKPLNLGVFPPEQSVVLIFDEEGEYTYHDQFHPERTGTVIVE